MEKAKKQIELPAFETMEQLMADNFLLKTIAGQVAYFNEERKKASNNGEFKLKQSPIEFLIGLNQFNEQSIAKEYLNINNKCSVLPFETVEFITLLISECVDATFTHYEVIFQKQKKSHVKIKES